jgi:RNA polymerase-binding transcription factor DksA
MTHLVIENYPDPIDRASELELISTADAIRTVQLKNVQKQVPGPDGLYPSPDCYECGDEIPLGRLQVAANNILCIVCATAAERWKR